MRESASRLSVTRWLNASFYLNFGIMAVLLVIVSLAVYDCEEARLELRDGVSLQYMASKTESNTLYENGRGAEVFAGSVNIEMIEQGLHARWTCCC